MTKTAARMLAQAARLAGETAGQVGRLVGAALESWHDEREPEPEKLVDKREIELERTRELLRRRGHDV